MLSSELYDIASRYVEKDITLEDLEDWLVPRLSFFFRLPYSSDTEFVAEIEMALADMSDRTVTEDEFRALLKDLLGRERIAWASYPVGSDKTYTASSNQASPTLQYTTSRIAYTWG